MNVTRYVTANVRRESQDPYRTEPNLSGPTAYVWGLHIMAFSSVTRGGATA